ncbi:MAG: class I tRNA ligase family protein, partial [Pedosphaera parvula]|nr:class I tRNA ligase family protein [Pedosphaera parvula]
EDGDVGEFAKLEADVLKAYDAYEFHVVYQRVSQFAAVELSAIYHDVIKDRMYTDAANSARRRSSQTALHRMVTGLCQMLSPILAFTADEAWEFVPGRAGKSVHASDWRPQPIARSGAETSAWGGLFLLREKVLPELEKARQAKEIGKALEAKLTLNGLGELFVDAKAHEEALRELLNVSQLEVHANGDPNVPVLVRRADGQKCERCWHWETDVGSQAEHPTICGRCVEAVGAVTAEQS